MCSFFLGLLRTGIGKYSSVQEMGFCVCMCVNLKGRFGISLPLKGFLAIKQRSGCIAKRAAIRASAAALGEAHQVQSSDRCSKATKAASLPHVRRAWGKYHPPKFHGGKERQMGSLQCEKCNVGIVQLWLSFHP